MRRLLRWYGASPLHLLALLGCFALAGYAAARLVPSRPVGVAVWFLGAVAGHDLLLMPLYTLADRSAMAVIRHCPPRLPSVPWINYLRVPAGLSALLLLVWFPLILRLHTSYRASTTLSPDPYLGHWLAVTGALFLLSAAMMALRLRRIARRGASPSATSHDQNYRQTPAAVPGPESPRPAQEPHRGLRQAASWSPTVPPPDHRPGTDQDDNDDHAAGSAGTAQRPDPSAPPR